MLQFRIRAFGDDGRNDVEQHHARSVSSLVTWRRQDSLAFRRLGRVVRCEPDSDRVRATLPVCALLARKGAVPDHEVRRACDTLDTNDANEVTRRRSQTSIGKCSNEAGGLPAERRKYAPSGSVCGRATKPNGWSAGQDDHQLRFSGVHMQTAQSQVHAILYRLTFAPVLALLRQPGPASTTQTSYDDRRQAPTVQPHLVCCKTDHAGQHPNGSVTDTPLTLQHRQPP